MTPCERQVSRDEDVGAVAAVAGVGVVVDEVVVEARERDVAAVCGDRRMAVGAGACGLRAGQGDAHAPGRPRPVANEDVGCAVGVDVFTDQVVGGTHERDEAVVGRDVGAERRGVRFSLVIRDAHPLHAGPRRSRPRRVRKKTRLPLGTASGRPFHERAPGRRRAAG